ncbi:hypothetical protein D3C81_1708400 [compost metagenome]
MVDDHRLRKQLAGGLDIGDKPLGQPRNQRLPDGPCRVLRHLLDQPRIADRRFLAVAFANHATEFLGRHRRLSDMRNAFGLVGIQERRGCQPVFHQRELPDQVQCIAYPLAHALRQEGRCHVRRIPEEEHPVGLPLLQNQCMESISGCPPYLIVTLRQPAGDQVLDCFGL